MQVILPIPFRTYNQGVVYVSSNLVTNKRSKYIDRKYHLVMDFATKRTIELEYIITEHTIVEIVSNIQRKVNPAISLVLS